MDAHYTGTVFRDKWIIVLVCVCVSVRIERVKECVCDMCYTYFAPYIRASDNMAPVLLGNLLRFSELLRRMCSMARDGTQLQSQNCVFVAFCVAFCIAIRVL